MDLHCMEVGLDPGDIVLDWDPAPLPKQWGRAPPPIFGPHLLCPNGCMDQDANDEDPATTRKEGTHTPANFWPMSIEAKLLDG